MYLPRWRGLFGSQLGERKTDSVTVWILKIDHLFEIKSLPPPSKKKDISGKEVKSK